MDWESAIENFHYFFLQVFLLLRYFHEKTQKINFKKSRGQFPWFPNGGIGKLDHGHSSFFLLTKIPPENSIGEFSLKFFVKLSQWNQNGKFFLPKRKGSHTFDSIGDVDEKTGREVACFDAG